MKKLLFALLILVSSIDSLAQEKNPWRIYTGPEEMPRQKGAARPTFPRQFRLFVLDQPALREQLFRVVGNTGPRSTRVSLPNADGGFEQFDVVEASNMEPGLQDRFREIRAFSGRGITDPFATLKLSYSPQGVQALVFRTGAATEFLEVFSADHTVYAAFRKQGDVGRSDWKCTTPDEQLTNAINQQVFRTQSNGRSGGNLKTLRLAVSVNGEYANFFGATSAAQVGLVLAAVNATMTRCNGVYERDFALHLNLIDATTSVFYYTPSSDPYSSGGFNNQLQTTLTNVIGEANYDIGHLFSGAGGGGNAGCIGCICTNGQKGRGWTASSIPQGDLFDIDYVAHELGHQLGGNHTFSHGLEGSGQNKEVGSGVTVMGYAGITAQDVARNSIDIFHATSVAQVQTNLNARSCPVTVTIANATPVIAPVPNYTIPISTPFALTGSATDADGDPLTYCWEQNDNAPTGQSGTNSIAYPAKPAGPNWLTSYPSASPTRIFPKLATVLAGNFVSGPLPGGDANANSEALSSVARTLNFRLTVRDNAPYSSNAPVKVGQTEFTDMVVTVTNSSGPFMVNAPNSPVSWAGGSTQTVFWSVANTTAAPVSCANVRILLSTDGGFTWPVVLADNTPNDGSEQITVPGTPTTTARIKVESVGNIFFDISNTNFTITGIACAITFSAQPAAASACPGSPASFSVAATTTGASLSYQWHVSIDGGVSYSDIAGANAATYSFTAALAQNGHRYRCLLSSSCGATATSGVAQLSVASATSISQQPQNVAGCVGSPATFSVSATGGSLTYQWQQSTDGGSSFINIGGATAASYTFSPTQAQNGHLFRCLVSSSCSVPVTTATASLSVNPATTLDSQPAGAQICSGNNASFSVTATGATLSYQWQVSTDAGASFTSIANSAVYSGSNTPTLLLAAVPATFHNYRYRCVVSSNCLPLTSNAATLLVNTAPAIQTQALDASVCGGQSASFAVNVSGTALTYQWQQSTNGGATFTDLANGGIYSGATTASLNMNPASPAMDGFRFRCVVSGTCTPSVTTAERQLRVFTPVSVTAQPANAAVCAGSTASFSVTATGTQPTYQWQQSSNGGASYANVPGGTSATLTLANTTTGISGNLYRCVVSGLAPCAPVVSSGALLTVNPIPVVSLQAAPYYSLVPGLSTTLTATSAPAAVSFQWFYNNTLLAGASGNTRTVSIDQVGIYQVRVTDAIGCNGTSNEVTITDSASVNLYIYPNPNNGQFQVRYFNPGGRTVPRTLLVYDAKGAVVYRSVYTITGLYERMDVLLPGVARGVYVVALLDAAGKRMAQARVVVR